MSQRILLDPTSERARSGEAPAASTARIPGRAHGRAARHLEARGDIFLDRIEARLRERGADVKRYRKPTFTKPAPA